MAEPVPKYEHRGEGALKAAARAGFALWEQDGVWVTHAGQGAAAAEFLAAYDPLPDARAAALRRLAEHRWMIEEAGIIANGIVMDTARDARGNLTGAVVAATLALQSGAQFEVTWKDKAGSTRRVGASEMIEVGLAVQQYVAGCFVREAELAAEIEAQTDWRALEKFDPAARWEK